ncbi:MAG: hypothetical protein KBA75_07480 [Alphaproteobacteria bacterium]|nr:hypothetical protein [Alphaproteobacteria bacterium]
MLDQVRTVITSKALHNGRDFTTLDLLKFVGLVTITADHIGYFIFPQEVWWRVVGHSMSPALWFFLVGYSRRRQIDSAWLWYAAIMTLQFLLIGGVPLLPLNIFVSFVVCRWWINICQDNNYLTSLPVCLLAGFAGFGLMLPADNILMQYGTAGLLYGMLGRMVREHQKHHILWIGCIAAASAFLSFYQGWHLTLTQATALLLLTFGTTLMLGRLENRVLIKNWPASTLMTVVTLLCRNTMHYFYAHVLVLHLIWRALQANLHP